MMIGLQTALSRARDKIEQIERIMAKMVKPNGTDNGRPH